MSSGKLSKSAAKEEALTQCSSHGETNCEVRLTYENQCAAISTPEINGKPSGTIHFSGSATIDAASADASSQCRKNNLPRRNAELFIATAPNKYFKIFRNSIAEPYQGEKAAPGKLAFTGAPSKQLASDDALSLCRKDNKYFNCRVIYTACSEPIFEKF
ncbi:DUF4189 domain-containing protein [Xanthomonas hortorum pv. pelargonii]|nr:DUF4189 domain-containing protein [Xanthomonas hortorum pv. pelargonii]